MSDATNLSEGAPDIIDWVHFEKSRAELGPGFIRILGYFREDGTKSVGQIEQAMHEGNATALVTPAHTRKARRASSAPSRWPRLPS